MLTETGTFILKCMYSLRQMFLHLGYLLLYHTVTASFGILFLYMDMITLFFHFFQLFIFSFGTVILGYKKKIQHEM